MTTSADVGIEDSAPEGGLLARPWRQERHYIINRHGRALLIVCGGTDEEDDRIAALVLGAVNPPVSEGRE